MKTHEHALISLGYGACVSLLLGGGLVGHPDVYLAAVLGGECIDFIDHPLYHLVYQRSEEHVAAAWQVLKEKGPAAWVHYLGRVEDGRQFKGLILHNIYALIALVMLIVVLFIAVPGEVCTLTFFTATLVHMLTDIQGDLRILGHINNWLWVLPGGVRLPNLQSPTGPLSLPDVQKIFREGFKGFLPHNCRAKNRNFTLFPLWP